MDPQDSLTLSQGVFVERGRGKRTRAGLEAFPDLRQFGIIQTLPQRAKLAKSYYNRLRTITRELEDGWNKEVGGQVGSFISQSLDLVRGKEVVTRIGFIPTPGLCSQESGRLFDVIQDQLASSLPFLARLNPFKSHNPKLAFQNICKQLLESKTTGASGVSAFEEECLESGPRYLSLHDLESWYNCQEPRPELIPILLEDADSFPPQVIPQLLHLLASSNIPVIFLIGGKEGTGLGRYIPPTASSTFTYTTFKTTSPTQRLDASLYKILNDEEVPFKLSGPLLDYLSAFFISQHLSMTRLLQAYHLCLIHHFQKPESIFCSAPRIGSQALLSPQTLQSSYEGILTDSKGRLEEKGQDEMTEIQIHEKIKNSIRDIQEWLLMLNVMYFLKSNISSQGSGGSFRELYIECAGGSFYNIGLDRILKDLNPMSKCNVLEVLKGWNQSIEEYVEGKELSKRIQDILKRLQTLERELEGLDGDGKVTKAIKEPEISFKRIRNIRELQAELSSQKVDSAFLSWKSSLTKFLREIVKKYLKGLSEIRGWRAFVYEDVSVLKSVFSPLPQTDIVSALLCPSQLLDCPCCSGTEKDSIHQSLPDSSILFKLLQEQTSKKVDLNSIYGGFGSFMETPEPGPKSAKKGRSLDSSLAKDLTLLRFREAIGELQHVGIVKRSKVKPDEVTKLLWR